MYMGGPPKRPVGFVYDKVFHLDYLDGLLYLSRILSDLTIRQFDSFPIHSPFAT